MDELKQRIIRLIENANNIEFLYLVYKFSRNLLG